MKKNVFFRFIIVTHTVTSLYPIIPQSLWLAIWNRLLECLRRVHHGRGFKNLPWSLICLRCIRADLHLITNTEHFARIDWIDWIFDYERNQWVVSGSKFTRQLVQVTAAMWVIAELMLYFVIRGPLAEFSRWPTYPAEYNVWLVSILQPNWRETTNAFCDLCIEYSMCSHWKL